jgi:phenylacetate-CoA ligase
VNDPDTMRPKGPGEKGVAVVTTLFKHAAPMIRYNMNDITASTSGECSCGSKHARISGIYGRSDNMVKLKGVNVFPEAIGAVVSEDPRTTGEYICLLDRDSQGRDEMTVQVEAADGEASFGHLEDALRLRLKETLGVTLKIQAVKRGGVARLTGLTETSKIKRLIDRRATPHS